MKMRVIIASGEGKNIVPRRSSFPMALAPSLFGGIVFLYVCLFVKDFVGFLSYMLNIAESLERI